jgi:hypothetical protein
MGVVLILTPIVVGSWPIISAAVVAAAAGLGLQISGQGKSARLSFSMKAGERSTQRRVRPT